MQLEQGSPGRTYSWSLLFPSAWFLPCQTQLSESCPRSPNWRQGRLSWPGTGLFLGHCQCCLSRGSTNINLGHIRTRTGHRACQGFCHVPNEQMFLPQHSSWGWSNAFKKKKKQPTLFTLIMPFCCLCLFCFALLFFPYIKNCSREEILPSCFWEQTLP